MLAHPVPLNADVRAHPGPVKQVGDGHASLQLGAQSRRIRSLSGPQLVDDHGLLGAVAIFVGVVMRSDLVLARRGPSGGPLEELIEDQGTTLVCAPFDKGRLFGPAALTGLSLEKPHRQQQTPDSLGGLVRQQALRSNRL